MHAFRALPQPVYVKLSFLLRVDANWDESEVVAAAVHKMIALFTPQRCFFASNFPVDAALGWPQERLFPVGARCARCC